MFVCKLRTPSCANYEHFHVYLAYRRQTGTVVTRQTYMYERAPNKTTYCTHFKGWYTLDKRVKVFGPQPQTATHL